MAITLWMFVLMAVLPRVEDPAPSAELAPLFERVNATGTLVVSNLAGDKTFVHNLDRAKQRMCPASTFKIANSLIAIDSEVLRDETQVLKWDGKTRIFPAWNKDQTMASAFAASCVWFYQEIAKKVGEAKYKRYLKQFDYGNGVVGADTTTFWLDDSLQVSAMEQITFLRALLNRKLGVSDKAYAVLRKIMKTTPLGNCSMWAKTGWSARTKKPVGWYVGYAESKDGTWLFALNIDMESMKSAPLRIEIVRNALTELGLCR